MQIVLNGKPFETIESQSVRELIHELKLEGRIAVEVNKIIIPRSKFTSHILNPDDHVEIVHAIGGG